MQDYPEGNNSSDYLVQTTTYLPENFTYSPYLPCPEKLPYMRKEAGPWSEPTAVDQGLHMQEALGRW
ncbi:hypothetical protein MC885_001937 [Smutsia gigantea]|nr:hypothetical protein MC885_001937 [Smutsia gigantea]